MLGCGSIPLMVASSDRKSSLSVGLAFSAAQFKRNAMIQHSDCQIKNNN
jgi:hypothetical protein